MEEWGAWHWCGETYVGILDELVQNAGAIGVEFEDVAQAARERLTLPESLGVLQADVHQV